jgi:hypothetical protein
MATIILVVAHAFGIDVSWWWLVYTIFWDGAMVPGNK